MYRKVYSARAPRVRVFSDNIVIHTGELDRSSASRTECERRLSQF